MRRQHGHHRMAGWVTMLAMLLGVAASPAAADELPPGGSFVDDNGGVHERWIEAIRSADITRGCNPPANNRYCPSHRVTRGQMAAFLVRALDLTESSRDGRFADVPPDHRFVGDINRLATAGITRGCGDDRYCPGRDVTRGQMAAFLVRALALRETSPDGEFADVPPDHRFVGDINRLATAGITAGCNPPGNTQFCPDRPVNRAEMATFLGRALGDLEPVTPVAPAEAPPEAFAPFARADGVALHIPALGVELVGFHEGQNSRMRQLTPVETSPPDMTLPTRHRSTPSRSAADIAVDPDEPLRAPVTGQVVEAEGYHLYCRYPDNYVTIAPDDHPEWEVTIIHITALRVSPGDRVVAGETVVADSARQLPFASQIDKYTVDPSWPHAHIHMMPAETRTSGISSC